MSSDTSSDSRGLVSASVVIDAPADTVFAILTDPEQHPRIDGSGTLVGKVRGPKRLHQGSTFGVDMKMFGAPYKMRNKVVEFEEGRLIAWRTAGPHRWRYELEPTTGGGTRVTETWDATVYPWPVRKALALAGFPARNRAGIEATLPRLKAAAEGDPERTS